MLEINVPYKFLSKTKIIFGSQAIILSHKVNDVGPMMGFGNLAIFPPFDRENDCKRKLKYRRLSC